MIKERFHIALRKINEAEFGKHSYERIEQRLDSLGDDISDFERDQIIDTINLLKQYDFPRGSYIVKLGDFDPDPASDRYIEVNRRGYYRIIDDEVFTDSTGDEIWVIIRDNRVITVMLRKSIQTLNPEKNARQMRVDKAIDFLPAFIKANNLRLSGGNR